MARGLAIETSGRVGEIAISEGGRAVAVERFGHGLRHAAGVVPIVERLCRGRGWRPGDVEEVYVSAGPGSFTGLRVGVTVAKILAFATGARVVAVPTVEVLARNAPAGWQHLIVVLDAKRGQIFTASFDNVGGEPVVREPARVSTLAEMLARTPRPVHLLGEGLPYHEGALEGLVEGGGIVLTTAEQWQARAQVVAAIGAQMAGERRLTDADVLTPTYLRRPEAEDVYEAKHGQG